MNNLKVSYVSINEISPADYNPRKWSEAQTASLKESITRFGLVDPLICNSAPKRKNILLGGHFRLKVAKELGFKEVPVVYVCISDIEKEKELNLRLNKNTGEFDMELLKDFDEELLSDVGFSSEELDDIFVDLGTEDDGFDVKKELEKIKKPKSKLGDLYKLGNHRLLCGDSTKLESVQKLVGKNKIDMIYCDPVYNINLSYKNGIGGTKNYGGSAKDNKSEDEYRSFLYKTMKNGLELSNKDAHVFYYCDETYVPMIADIYKELGITFRRICIWLKGIANPTPQIAFSKVYEPCVYGTRGKPYLSPNSTNYDEVLNKDTGTGIALLESVADMFDTWAVQRLAGNEYEHPTEKPVTLHEKPIRRCTPVGGNILSLFGGSGGELMASEQLKRNCFMIEMDPVFVDLIVRRYEALTGKKALICATDQIL